MAGFLTNLGLAAGQNILYGQQFQERQADLDLKKQEIQMNNLAMQQQQAQAQSRQEIGQFLSSEAAKDASSFTDPVKATKLYSDGAGAAMRRGDFTTAGALETLAKGKAEEAKQQMVLQAEQKQQKLETLATAADNYTANPTPEGAKDLMRKAVDAGQDPTQIPMPGTPQWGAWTNQQTLASKTAAQRADYLQKVADQQARLEERRAEHQDNVALRQQSMAQSAMLREAMIGVQKSNQGLREQELQLHKDEFDFRKQQAAGGGRMGVQQQRDTAAIAGAAAEGARNLRNLAQFPLGTAGSPFQNLTDHNLVGAVSRMGTNAFTPEAVQMFQTAGAGLATQVGRVETLGGGRGVNQAQINQLEKQLTPVAGDHPITQLYKVATGAELLKTRMENTPPPQDPKMREQWDKTLADLNKYPTPESILSASTASQKKELLQLDRSYADNLNKIRSSGEGNVGGGTGLPGGSDAGAGLSAPPIPSGWSVKAH